MFVPREIFRLINPQTISVFLTCSSFYNFVDIFYRKYNVDVETKPFIILTNGFFKKKPLLKYNKKIYQIV
jgi:hypothetical protein